MPLSTVYFTDLNGKTSKIHLSVCWAIYNSEITLKANNKHQMGGGGGGKKHLSTIRGNWNDPQKQTVTNGK